MDSQAAAKERLMELELDQISTSGSATREKEVMREDEKEAPAEEERGSEASGC